MENSSAVSLAYEILNAAKTGGVQMRLTGGVAVWIRCPDLRNEILKDRTFKDVDFVAFLKDKERISEILKLKKFTPHPVLEADPYSSYSRFLRKKNNFWEDICDINYDCIAYNHKINIKKRLLIDEITIPLAELLLSKLQAVEIALQDISDLQALILEHNFANNIDGDKINISLITKLCGIDWGLEKTVKKNIESLLKLTLDSTSLEQSYKMIIKNKLSFLTSQLNNGPKSLFWRARSFIGEKIKWYHDVDPIDNINDN